MKRILRLSLLVIGLMMLCASCTSQVSDLDAANEELHKVKTAVQACLADADTDYLDASVTAWDGSPSKAKATSENDTVYDAAQYVRGMVFRATYDISLEGLITDAHNISWKGVDFDGTYPQVSHWVEYNGDH